MKVCIAEKPSVAREIAQIVGAKDKKDGYFEGNGYAVTWTFGHFCSLYAPDDYDQKWKSWTLDNLPMLPEKFETKLIPAAWDSGYLYNLAPHADGATGIRRNIEAYKQGAKKRNSDPNYAKKLSQACKGKREVVTCPKCGTSGGGGNMRRYHFDKCKK